MALRFSRHQFNVVCNNFSIIRDHSTVSELDSSKLDIKQARLSEMKAKPPVNKLAFGKVFTDHMLTIDWSKSNGWAAPQIVPFENFSIHPGAKVRDFCNGNKKGTFYLTALFISRFSIMHRNYLRVWRHIVEWMEKSACFGQCTTWQEWISQQTELAFQHSMDINC